MKLVSRQLNCNLASGLLQAIARGEVCLHYQPIYALKGDEVKLAGFEALSRWGDVSPAAFVEAAEECGQLLPFCRWVFKVAMAQAKDWELGRRGLWMSVNLSPLHLINSSFLDEIKAIALSLDLDFSTLHLELTESEALSSLSLNTLQSMTSRFIIGIDDFGVGYSNLAQLGNVDIRFVKIDRSLIPHSTDDRKRLILLRAIANVARMLRIKTILEGIETEEQRAIASICGIDYGQGWLWAKALPPEDAALLLGG